MYFIQTIVLREIQELYGGPMFISQMCNIVLNSLDSSARRLLEVSKNTIINLNCLSWKLRMCTQSILSFFSYKHTWVVPVNCGHLL